MNVKGLKQAIKNLPDGMEIILQKDAEGNGYSPLAGFDEDAIYIAHTTWSGEVYSTEWSADDAGMNEKEWDNIKLLPKSLILFPIN